MKRLLKFMIILVMSATAMLVVGCTKPEDPNNGENGGSNNGGENNGGGTYNGYEYVDLGLPSGTLWATVNVGADMPEGYGHYFAWGETQPKDCYDWDSYVYCDNTYGRLTKYCSDPIYGYEGFTDDLTTLLPDDDAATATWGNGWRMPTKEEWEELYENTTITWITQDGVNGMLFTAANGNSMFLPTAGVQMANHILGVGYCCYYWSNSLYLESPLSAWGFLGSSTCIIGGHGRIGGMSVRAVRSER